MGWLELGLAVFVGAAIILVPGVLTLVALGMRLSRSMGFGFPVGLGVFGLAAAFGGLLGVPWTWFQPLVLIVALAVLAAWRSHRHRHPSALSTQEKLGMALAGVGIVFFASLFIKPLVSAMGTPDAVPHYGDAAFHLQGVEILTQNQDSNPLNALSALYDPVGGAGTYYPNLWHSLTALLATLVGTTTATNAMVIVFSAVIWPVGLASLAIVLRPRAVISPLVVNIFAASVVIFPVILGASFAIYPFSLSMAVFPAAVSLLLLWDGECRRPIVGGSVLSAVGITLAQPASGLLYLVVLAAVGIAILIVRQTTWLRSGRTWVTAFSAIGVIAAAAVLFTVLSRSVLVQSLGGFERPTLGYKNAAKGMLNGTIAVTYPWTAWWAIVALAAVGAVILLRSSRGRAAVFSFLGFAVIYLASAGPDNGLRMLTGPFYKDYQRLSVPVIMFLLVFAATAVGAGVQMLFRLVPQSAAALTGSIVTIALLGGGLYIYYSQDSLVGRLKTDYLLLGYGLTPGIQTVSLDYDELVILRDLDTYQFPEGSRLVGVPSSGAMFAPAVSDMSPFFPLVMPQTEDQRYLALNFNNILEDPEVCRIVNEANIVAFLEVGDSDDGSTVPQQFEGFDSVDTGEGFALLNEQGGARLWEITVCQ